MQICNLCILHKFSNLDFSDIGMAELKVRPEDLQFCTEKSSGVDKLGKFQFGDMVQIDNQNVGVIIRLEKDSFEILNQHVSAKNSF